MPSKKTIQAQKDFAFNMSLLMSVMKSVALSQFVSFKKSRVGRYTTFMNYFAGFFHMLDLTKSKNPLIRAASPVLGVVIVTSDVTMLSGLNNKLIRCGLDAIGDQPCHVMVTGTKGATRIKNEELPYQAFPPLTFSNLYESSVMIKDHIMKQIKEKKMGRTLLVFAEFVSMGLQKPTVIELLPMNIAYPQNLNEGVDPKEMIHLESKIDPIAEYLCDLWLTYRLWYSFQDNKLSEVAFQAGQLEGGIQNLEELKRRLRITLTKKNREIVDNGLREIVTAMIAVVER